MRIKIVKYINVQSNNSTEDIIEILRDKILPNKNKGIAKTFLEHLNKQKKLLKMIELLIPSMRLCIY